MYGWVMIASGPGITLKLSLAATTLNRAPEDFSGTGGTGYSFDMAYQELEMAFNEMMEAVNERLGSGRSLEAEDDSYSRPESESVLG